MEIEFTGTIEHNADSIKALYQATYYTYDKFRILGRFAVGAMLVVTAFFFKLPDIAQVVLLMAGAWLIVSKDFLAAEHARQAIKARKEDFPVIQYSFSNDGVMLTGQKSIFMQYECFEVLYEDDGYLYLFEAKDSICVIEKSSVSLGGVPELKLYLQQQTGKVWHRKRSLLHITIYDIVHELKNK